MSVELWDAVDREGRLLGFDWVRGEPAAEGVYHHVIMVFTITDRGNILITQRHPDKPHGLKWEVTGGSVLKGEKPLDGAVRELSEETGIQTAPEELRLIFTHVWDGIPAIYHFYGVRVREGELSVVLQPGETVDWKLIPYGRFKKLVRQKEYPMFPDSFCRRFPDFEPLIDRFVLS